MDSGRVGASRPRPAPTGLCELGQATSRGPRVSICRLTTLIFSAKSSCSHFFQPLDVRTDAVPPDPHRSICYLYRRHRCIQLSAMHPSSHSPIHSIILPQSTPPSSISSTCLYTHHLAEPRVQSQIYKEYGKHTVCQLWVRARAQSPNPDPDLSTMPGTSRALGTPFYPWFCLRALPAWGRAPLPNSRSLGENRKLRHQQSPTAPTSPASGPREPG